MNELARGQALEIIKDHGITATQQTAVLNGEWVKSGTSFFEEVGDKSRYTAKEVFEFLGY